MRNESLRAEIQQVKVPTLNSIRIAPVKVLYTKTALTKSNERF